MGRPNPVGSPGNVMKTVHRQGRIVQPGLITGGTDNSGKPLRSSNGMECNEECPCVVVHFKEENLLNISKKRVFNLCDDKIPISGVTRPKQVRRMKDQQKYGDGFSKEGIDLRDDRRVNGWDALVKAFSSVGEDAGEGPDEDVVVEDDVGLVGMVGAVALTSSGMMERTMSALGLDYAMVGGASAVAVGGGYGFL